MDLQKERQRLLDTWTREELIGWLCWNDPNGSYTDEACRREDIDPLDHEMAVDLVMANVEDNMETPEEMMRGSLRANPQRYPKPEEFDRFLKR